MASTAMVTGSVLDAAVASMVIAALMKTPLLKAS
jgi:hypothetical protein